VVNVDSVRTLGAHSGVEGSRVIRPCDRSGDRPASHLAGNLLSKGSSPLNIIEIIRHQSSRAAAIEAATLLVIIGIVDILTGYEVSLVLFYAAPVLITLYWCANWVPYLTALLCGLVWWGADVISGHPYSNAMVRGWELLFRFVFFALVAVAGTAIKRYSRTSKGRIDLLEANRQLERQLVEISEHERERIGQDLHDGLCQYLAAIHCTAAALKSELERANLPSFAAAADDVTQLLQSAVSQAHDLARGLVPVQLGEGGLSAALEQLAFSTTRLMGVPCAFQPSGTIATGNDARMHHLYRIAQEAVNNAAKHAKPCRIDVTLSGNANATILSVADDGVGISKTTKNQRGLGMNIMKSRSTIIGGEFFIEEPTRGGTVISCAMHHEEDNGGIGVAPV
jgi:signal transduction histidine kinase